MFIVRNTTIHSDANIEYSIIGTEYYYDLSDYPVTCSIKEGTDRCNFGILQSQDIILALSPEPNDPPYSQGDYYLELKYETVVPHAEMRNSLTVFVCLWSTAGAVLILLMLMGIILLVGARKK